MEKSKQISSVAGAGSAKTQLKEDRKAAPSSTSSDDAKQKELRLDKLRKRIDVGKVWEQVEGNLSEVQLRVIPVPGWKTVRIFVSSTFKDFHEEREVLIKQVFADLRAWCEERLLHLVDCDLRWGVPHGTSSEETLKICLEEIDRCYKENIAPYFVNMTCKRIGWIPMDEEEIKEILADYKLVLGLSVTEMEIVHAAYRIDNPNALFLIRDESFLKDITDLEVRKEFFDHGDDADPELRRKMTEKLETLKRKIMDRFAEKSPNDNRVALYKCQYIKEAPPSDPQIKVRPKLKLSDDFSKTVYNFFKERIERQYRVSELHAIELDHYEVANYHHHAFMNSLSEIFFGREDILAKISLYITDGTGDRPLVITGMAGTGKTSIMANAAHATLEKFSQGDNSSKVFYHFVGAVPNSGDLSFMLKRLLKEIQPGEDLPEILEELIGAAKSLLSHTKFESKVVIFVDAINQLDSEKLNLWLPTKLSPNLRLICSVISLDSLKAASELAASTSESQLKLDERFHLITVSDLDEKARREIVTRYLIRFNKTLHEKEQMDVLMCNAGSRNALWLSVACEEMRICGDFRKITQLIGDLPNNPKGLLRMVLKRLEKESDASLLRSTLCLLEVSKGGLLEYELLEILPQFKEKKPPTEEQITDRPRGRDRLPSLDWAIVYRNLRIFLRPFGNPSEGRLNLYHSILKDVVREMYLNEKGEEETEAKSEISQTELSDKTELVSSELSSGEIKDRRWWHKKLANYFSKYSVYDRRVEEYPFHLLELKKYATDDSERDLYCRLLEEFLLDLRTVKRLFNYEFSGDLLHYWRQCGDEDYVRMNEGYQKILADMRRSMATRPQPSEKSLAENCELISRLLAQAGHYSESLKLAKDCLEIAQKQNYKDNEEKLMYLYGHEAYLRSLILGSVKEESHDQIKELKSIIKLHEKAVQIIKDLRLDEKDNNCKKHLGLQLIKIAFARGQIASRRRFYEPFQKRTDKTNGLSEVEEAIKLYQSINDHNHELEALLTKATLYKGDEKTQIEIYETTMARCQELMGENCPLMGRLCFNMGVVYQCANDMNNAYKYYKQANMIANRIYGPMHVKTEKYKKQALECSEATNHSPEDIDRDQ